MSPRNRLCVRGAGFLGNFLHGIGGDFNDTLTVAIVWKHVAARLVRLKNIQFFLVRNGVGARFEFYFDKLRLRAFDDGDEQLQRDHELNGRGGALRSFLPDFAFVPAFGFEAAFQQYCFAALRGDFAF